MLNNICVFDLEADSLNTDIANPTEVACYIIDRFTLDPIEGSWFSSCVKPPNIDDKDYLSPDRISTLQFHCKLNNCSQEELLNKWRGYPDEATVWELFSKHINKYNHGNQNYTAPIPAGQNIRNYDLLIVNRKNEKYKIKRMFYDRDIIDLRDITFLTLVWDKDLKSRSMDSLRKYFGISDEKAHTADKDIEDTGAMISRYLKYFKAGFNQNKFKNSFKND